MKTILPILLLLLSVNITIAQEILHTAPNVTVDILVKPEIKTGEILVGVRENKNFTVGYFKKDAFVTCYDATTLELSWRKTYPSEVEVSGIEYQMQSGYFIGEKIVLIYSGFNKKSKRYQFIKRVLDQEGNEERLTVFCRIPVKNEEDITFNISQELDNKYILIQAYTNWEVKSKYVRAHFFWLDKDMNMLDEYKFDTKVYPEDAHIADITVNEKKDVFLLVDKNKEKRDNKNYRGEYIIWKCSAGNEMISRDYNLGEQFINDANLNFDEFNQELVIQGFLGFKRRDQINGIYAHVLTPELIEKQMKVLPVTKQLVEDWIGERELSDRLARGDKLNLQYKESISTPDGGTYVIYEDTKTEGLYWAGDIIIMYYNAAHEIEFYSVLNKSSEAASHTSKYTVSYGRKLIGNDLFFYFSSKAKVLAKTYPDIKSLQDRSISDYGVLECHVQPNGTVNVTELFVYNASTKFFLVEPRDFNVSKSLNEIFFTIGDGFCNRKWPVVIKRN